MVNTKDGYQIVLDSIVYNVFDKKSSGSAVRRSKTLATKGNYAIMQNQ